MIKLSEQEKADLKVYVQQEPFRLFQKVLLQWHETVAGQLRDSATPDNILIFQGVLRGLSAAATIVAHAATDPNFGLEAKPLAPEAKQKPVRGSNRRPIGAYKKPST